MDDDVRSLAFDHAATTAGLASAPSSFRSSIELVVGDLVAEQADVLIAAAADGIGSSSRVQLALRRAAGEALATAYDEAVARRPGGRLVVGEHVVTPGFGLACRRIVHCLPAPAPRDHDAQVVTIAHALRHAFDVCRTLGAESVALPAIGTGAYGYRVSAVALASVRCASDLLESRDAPRRIRFVLAGPATLEAFLHALSDERARRQAAHQR